MPASYHRGVTRMLLVLLAAAAVVAAPAAGQTPRQIRVDVQFRQTGMQGRDAAGVPANLKDNAFTLRAEARF